MSGATTSIDAASIELLLNELRLPGVKAIWPKIAAQSDKEGWPAARFLAALAEHESAKGRVAASSGTSPRPDCPPAKPRRLRLRKRTHGVEGADHGARVRRRLAQHRSQPANLRPPGGGKSQLSAAIGLAPVENGWRVLFARTTDLVQRFQAARRELALEAAIAKLDRYDLLILDDIAYVTKV
jgi:hypothetical protein